MRRRAFTYGLLSLGLCLVVSQSVARADFVTNPQILSIPTTQTDWGPSTPSGKNPFVIQQFNPATYSTPTQTAVLTAVEVRLDYEFDNTIMITLANLSSSATESANGSMKLLLPNQMNLLPTQTFSNSHSLPGPQNMLTQTWSDKFPGSTMSPVGGFTDPTLLSQFKGTSTISLPVVAAAVSSFSGNNATGSSVTSASASINLFYHYVLLPIPEPSSLALLGMGGLALLWRFRGRVFRKLPV